MQAPGLEVWAKAIVVYWSQLVVTASDLFVWVQEERKGEGWLGESTNTPRCTKLLNHYKLYLHCSYIWFKMHLYLKKKLILPQESNYEKVSFEWSNHRSSTTEIVPCENTAEEVWFESWDHRISSKSRERTTLSPNNKLNVEVKWLSTPWKLQSLLFCFSVFFEKRRFPEIHTICAITKLMNMKAMFSRGKASHFSIYPTLALFLQWKRYCITGKLKVHFFSTLWQMWSF